MDYDRKTETAPALKPTAPETPRDNNSLPATADDSKSDKMKRLLLFGAVAAVLIAAIFYGIGFAQGRGDLNEQKTAYEQRVNTLQGEVQQAQTQQGMMETYNRMLAARGWLHRAAIEMDRRNFGLANRYLNQASLILTNAMPEKASIDAAQINSLQEDIAATRIQVSTDVQAQRTRILGMAERLNNLLPQQIAGADVR